MEDDLLLEHAVGQEIAIEVKLNKTPTVPITSSLEKCKKEFSGIAVKEMLLLSLTECTFPLTREVTAIIFDDYVLQVAS